MSDWIRKMVSELDLSSFVLKTEVPFCPKCGAPCQRNGRKSIWACDLCNYSISLNSWKIVLLHASILDKILEIEGIEYILYHGVPIERTIAILPSHLLPLFVTTAIEMGESVGMANPTMLTLSPISDQAANTPNSLLALNASAENFNCPIHESLQLVTAAAQHAINKYRLDEPKGSTMDFTYIYQPNETYDSVEVSQVSIAQ